MYETVTEGGIWTGHHLNVLHCIVILTTHSDLFVGINQRSEKGYTGTDLKALFSRHLQPTLRY